MIGEIQVPFEDSLQRLVEFDNKRDEILIYFYTNFNIEVCIFYTNILSNKRIILVTNSLNASTEIKIFSLVVEKTQSW